MPVTRMMNGTLQIALIFGRIFDPMKLSILAKLFEPVDWSPSKSHHHDTKSTKNHGVGLVTLGP